MHGRAIGPPPAPGSPPGRAPAFASAAALLCLGCLSCAPAYRPGDLLRAPDVARAVDCLDVAVDVSRPPDTMRSVVVRYDFGNRCPKLASVDLGAVRVFARSEGGNITGSLSAFDPKSEIKRLPLDEVESANEAIRYDSSDGLAGATVCVDLSPLAGRSGGETPPICRPFDALATTAITRDQPVDFEIGDYSCHETSPVLGYRKCLPFGPWRARLPFTFALSFSVPRLDPGGRILRGTTDAGTPYSLRGGLLGGVSGIEFDFHFRYTVGPVFFGLEFGMGGFWTPDASDPAGGAAVQRRFGALTVIGGGAVVGVLLPRRGRFGGHLEALLGGRRVALALDQPGGDACNGDPPAGCSAGYGEWLIEPRAAFDFWIDRWATVSVWAGTNVLAPAEVTGGLMIGMHDRAFDGR